MLFVSLLRWWYGQGWLDQLGLVRERFARTADYFSFELTIRSLFKPFRQIDAEGVQKGPIGLIARALFDQLFSRLFGAVLRTFLLLIGAAALMLTLLIGAVRLAAWPLLLPAPLLSIGVALSGWFPWR